MAARAMEVGVEDGAEMEAEDRRGNVELGMRLVN